MYPRQIDDMAATDSNIHIRLHHGCVLAGAQLVGPRRARGGGPLAEQVDRGEAEVLGLAAILRVLPPGVTTPGQSGGPKVGNFHQTPRKFNGEWVGILCNREAKGPLAKGSPGLPELASRAATAAGRGAPPPRRCSPGPRAGVIKYMREPCICHRLEHGRFYAALT
jgi:hypothetical protein